MNSNDYRRELESLYLRPGHLARRASQLATALFTKLCPEVTPRQHSALVVLSKINGLDQKGLAKLLFIDQTNVGMIIKGLEKKGFIRRVSNLRDRRQKLLELTESGRLAFEAIHSKAAKLNDIMLDPLEEDEKKELIRLLQKILPAPDE